MEPFYRTVALVLTATFGVKRWRLDAAGLENVPETGGAVIASNHISYMDFTFIGKAAFARGRRVRILGKKEIYENRFAGWAMDKARHIKVDRHGDPGRAVELAVEAAQAGEVILLYPETTISRSFVPLPGKSGAVRIAQQAGVPLIPAAVWGCHRLITKGRPRSLKSGVATSVVFDEPMPLDPDEDAGAATSRLMERITALVDGLAVSYPQQPDDVSEAWWMPAHLGGAAPTPEEVARIMATEREERKG